jgi:hypothetical protein
MLNDFTPPATTREIKSEFYDRMLRIDHILPAIMLVHVEEFERELPSGWEDLFESPEYPGIAQKEFDLPVAEDRDFYGMFCDLAGAQRGREAMGYFVCYSLPVISAVRDGGESLSHNGWGRTRSYWLYTETMDQAALTALVVAADAQRRSEIEKLLAKQATSAV